MLEVVNPTYSKFENEMYTVICHYSPHVIISKESLDFFLLFKIVKMVVDIVLIQKSFDQKTALCGVSPLAGHFFQSHPVENGFPVSTFPYLNTIWKTNS